MGPTPFRYSMGVSRKLTGIIKIVSTNIVNVNEMIHVKTSAGIKKAR